MRETHLLWVLFITLTLPLVSGCAAPLQQGGVVVRAGAEARLDVICRYRAADSRECAALGEEGD